VFKERLVKLRVDKGLSQYELAKILKLSRGQISNYELGSRQPDYETLTQLADFFDVSTDYLLGRTNDPSLSDTQHVNSDEALEYLDELHKRPEMKTLFQVGRKASKEDIETAITIIEALKKKGEREDE
jgi:transcriptional regulator with XRE-family HTH domain